ncbi:zinc finger MYM-type protein 1-like [Sergentomyia squamirostris]
MVQFMEDHPSFATGQDNGPDQKYASQQLWEKLKNKLNSNGPPFRDCKEWKKQLKKYFVEQRDIVCDGGALLEKEMLDDSDKKDAVRITVNYMRQSNKRPSTQEKIAFSKALIDIFPCMRVHSEEGYEFLFNPKTRSGLLFNRIKHLIEYEKKRDKVFSKKNDSESIDDEKNKDLAEELSEIKDRPTEKQRTLEVMDKSFHLRKKLLKTADKSKILLHYPRFMDTHGLIQADFAKSENIKNPSVAMNLKNLLLHTEFLQEVGQSASKLEDYKEWSPSILAFLCWLHELSATGNGRQDRASMFSEVVENFIVFCPENAKIPISSSPKIIAQGPIKNNITRLYIAVDGQSIVTDNSMVDAVDIFFKIHFVFDIAYHKSIRNFLKYIEYYIFNMKDVPGRGANQKVTRFALKYDGKHRTKFQSQEDHNSDDDEDSSSSLEKKTVSQLKELIQKLWAELRKMRGDMEDLKTMIAKLEAKLNVIAKASNAGPTLPGIPDRLSLKNQSELDCMETRILENHVPYVTFFGANQLIGNNYKTTELGAILCDDLMNDYNYRGIDLGQYSESKEHKEASITFRTRRKEGTSVCRSLEKQAKDTKIYNIEVLKRVVEVIKYLGERGYAFHGDDAIIGSPHNGNFLGIIELISKFDPFLAEHLAKHANKGRGHVNYLSKTIVEQLIKIMAKRVRKEIVSRIKRAKYFSISVDSSPDESHVDQLAVTAKYLEGACSVERFLTFIPHCGHKGNDMAEALLTFCEQEKINFADCRGQSYDNASNMSGKYKGMQAILKDKNPYAVFIPCAAHSLNLVVKAAAKIDLANTLFNLLQAVYNFFTNSTSRCDRLKVAFKTGEKEDHHDRLFPKNLSVTRWSARFDATKAIISGFAEIVKTLQAISEDMVDEKDITRKEASGLHHQLLKWENCVFLVFWSDILEKIHIVNKNLQGTNITLSSMLKQLRGLTEVIKSKRDKFSDYVELANKFTSEKPVEGRSRKPNVRNLPLDYGRAPAVSLDKTDTLRINGFIPVIEQVTSSLERRTSVYIDVADRFKLFSSLDHTEKEIEVMAAKLVESYPKDLEPGLKGELEMLFGMVKSMPKPEAVSTEMFLYQEVLELRSTFYNIEVALRIYLSLMITNASGERSFSKMKLIKNRLRTTMLDERLSNLALMSSESDILRELDFDEIKKDFFEQNRKTPSSSVFT